MADVKNPPEWAIDEALKRCGVDPDQKPLSDWRDGTYALVMRLFAAHIAEHEQPPVDPFRQAVKEAYDASTAEAVGYDTFVDRLTFELRQRGTKLAAKP